MRVALALTLATLTAGLASPAIAGSSACTKLLHRTAFVPGARPAPCCRAGTECARFLSTETVVTGSAFIHS